MLEDSGKSYNNFTTGFTIFLNDNQQTFL